MLRDNQSIRHYQRITDALTEMWHRGYRLDEQRHYLDGYLAALRNTNALESYLIHRLEEAVMKYMYDPSNFEMVQPEPDYY